MAVLPVFQVILTGDSEVGWSTQRRVPCFRTYAGEELRKLQSTIYGQGRQQTRAVTGIQIPSRFLSDEAPQMQRGRNKNEGIPSSISISI